MPRKRAAASAWVPAAGLKVEVGVSRGDVVFRAEAAVGEALNVARLLVAMARQIGVDAPDTLPHADSVPGVVLPYDWAEDFADARHTSMPKPPLGFRPPKPSR